MPVWKIFNRIKRQEFGDLETIDVVRKLSQVPASELKNWFAWQKSFPDWYPALSCPELRIHLDPGWIEHAPPPPAPLGVARERAPRDRRLEDRRRHPRVDLRLKVVIECGGRTFRSFTRNISVGGLKLEKQLPDWSVAGKTCRVFLSSPDARQSFEFRAILLADEAKSSRLSFESGNADLAKLIQQWAEQVKRSLAA